MIAMKEIKQKIIGYEVVKAIEASQPESAAGSVPSNVVHMHENVERPEILLGSTYKIKTPLSDHALYITINDIVLNEGTEYEQRRPFEIFINSKNMENFQWVLALTRVISAVFRKGGDATFLVEEMKAVFDPKGGYFKKGGKFMPSLVAEIGDVLENHMKFIGMIKTAPDEHQRAFIEKKKQELGLKKSEPGSEGAVSAQSAPAPVAEDASSSFPPGASLCLKCHTKAVIYMDNCMTCLNCGDSKCG
ncbi:conserved hypothetical protein [gamma proteobacterium HdN1]|nr:conserved hypothetical protein [gamma proteobacterium HdN1]